MTNDSSNWFKKAFIDEAKAALTSRRNTGTVVEDSPVPETIETEAEMTALLKTAEVGSVYQYVGKTGTYETGAYYLVEVE